MESFIISLSTTTSFFFTLEENLQIHDYLYKNFFSLI